MSTLKVLKRPKPAAVFTTSFTGHCSRKASWARSPLFLGDAFRRARFCDEADKPKRLFWLVTCAHLSFSINIAFPIDLFASRFQRHSMLCREIRVFVLGNQSKSMKFYQFEKNYFAWIYSQSNFITSKEGRKDGRKEGGDLAERLISHLCAPVAPAPSCLPLQRRLKNIFNILVIFSTFNLLTIPTI